jgi:hypothetical protein
MHLGNALLSLRPPVPGVALRFEANRETLARTPWTTTLTIATARGRRAAVPMDLRTLMFLPTAAYVGVSVAAPFRSARRNLKVLLLGLLLLELLLILLTALPLLTFLGGDGPIRAYSLGVPTRAGLHLVYRALVAPPAMAYVIPLLVLWVVTRWVPEHEPSKPIALDGHERHVSDHSGAHLAKTEHDRHDGS